MESNGTSSSTIRNRKGKTKAKEQTSTDENKNITKTKTCVGSNELLRNISVIYFIISVLCTSFIVVYCIGYGTSSPEIKDTRNMTDTNPVDALILSELEKADECFFRGQIKESLQRFSDILAHHPQSPRALWGFARVLDVMGGQSNNDHYIFDAKVALFDAISVPNVPRDVFIKSLTRLTELYIFTEPASSLDSLWGFLSTRYNHTLEPRHNFIQQLLRHKETRKRAEYKLIEMIENNPEDCISMALLGRLYQNRDNNFENAAFFLQMAIDLDCEGIRSRKFYIDINEVYIRLGQLDKAAEIARLGAERGLFLSPDQRSKSNADTPLTARPWWTYEQSTYKDSLEFLESHWEAIRDEGLAILNQESGSFKDDTENLTDEGLWQKMLLFRNGHRYDKNCDLAPITCELLDRVPDATTLTRGQIKFSVLTPGTHLWAHSGPTNCRIRAHLGLKIPEGPILRIVNETRTWVEGKFIIFDDSFEHEVWHEGKDESRLVLIVDFWHPDITVEQRKRIRRYN